MKTVLLLATALSLVLAQNATDDGLEDGQTKCPVDNNNDGDTNDADEFTICEFHQECVEAANKTFSRCISKGNKVCYLYSRGGESGTMLAGEEVHASRSCCAVNVVLPPEACSLRSSLVLPLELSCSLSCSSRETCVEVNDPGANFYYDIADYDYSPVPYNVGQVARNGWKNAKGEAIENKPRMCVPKVSPAAPPPPPRWRRRPARSRRLVRPRCRPAATSRARRSSTSPRAPGRSSRRGARWSSSSSRPSSCS